MAGNTSSIPAAVEAMLGHLQTVASTSSLADVQVTDGAPIEYTSDYILSVNGWSNHKQIPATSSGYFSRWEEYDLDLQIHTWQGDTNPDARRDEAFALLEALVLLLLADKNGNGALTQSGYWAVTDTSAVQGPADGTTGWGVDMSIVVHCQDVFLTVY